MITPWYWSPVSFVHTRYTCQSSSLAQHSSLVYLSHNPLCTTNIQCLVNQSHIQVLLYSFPHPQELEKCSQGSLGHISLDPVTQINNIHQVFMVEDSCCSSIHQSSCRIRTIITPPYLHWKKIYVHFSHLMISYFFFLLCQQAADSTWQVCCCVIVGCVTCVTKPSKQLHYLVCHVRQLMRVIVSGVCVCVCVLCQMVDPEIF